MTIGCRSFFVFVMLNKVSMQEIEKGVIGGSVVLPCSSTECDDTVQDTEVHWRHNGSENVCDIVKGESSVEKQDQRYKKRAVTFPEEYPRGNFSIKLKNLTHDDAGEFSCFIASPSYSKQETVKLIIQEPTAKESDSVKTSNWIYIVPVLLLVIVCLILICWIKTKKNKASSVSYTATQDKEQ